ncbi:MAG TPA: AIPR family protein [Streptosporangiaceae bacterium]|nr:AIPR family protein [Streptosporangiaceae bacterium]
MADADLAEFVSGLHERVQERVEADPDLMTRDAFVAIAGESLIDDGSLDDLETCYLRMPWQNRTIEVAGYDIAGDGTILHLVAAEFGLHGASVRRDRIGQMFRGISAFAEFCRTGQHKLLEPTSAAYDMAERIHSAWPGLQLIRIFILSDGAITALRLKESTIAGLAATASLWDITRLHRLASSGKRQEEILIDLDARGYSISCLESPQQLDGYKCLMAILPGKLLAELYDEHHSRLLQRNVRAFLQARGKVNKGIAETISTQPGRFLAYNNGVSATAREARIERDSRGSLVLHSLTDLQIVNGGQTTASLHNAARRGIDLSGVYVPAKITLIADQHLDAMVPEISRCANSQNAVTAADFEGNSPFHVGLERLSRSIWAPSPDGLSRQTHWYYERVRGQYDVDRSRYLTVGRRRDFEQDNPRRQRFSKTDAAKYEFAYELRPHVVCQGAEKCFRTWTIDGELGEREAPSAEYFRALVAKAILFSRMRELIQKQRFGGYLAQTTAHALALIRQSLGEIDLDLVWGLQDLPEALAEVIPEVAAQVRTVLISPPDSANVTEWCKKEACWDRVRSVRWIPPASVRQLSRPR